MNKDNWLAGLWFGNAIALEICFWLAFLLVFLTGMPGFIALAAGIALAVAMHWGKVRYSCPACSYSMTTTE